MFLTQIDIPDNSTKSDSNKENSIKSGSFSSISKKPPVTVAKNNFQSSIKEQKYSKPNNIFSNKINNQAKPMFKNEKKEPQVSQDPDSPTSSRPIKKFRSSDDGIGSSRNSTSSAENGGTPLRRIRSDNHVTANSKVVDLKPLCTQEQIERKKLEAKMKRQLRSQMKN